MITLSTSIKELIKVGTTTAKLLKSIDIEVVEDLLFYFPFRYDDYSDVTLIRELRPGMTTNIVGYVELIQNKRSPVKRMNITEALISDDSGTVKIIWFNQAFITKNVNIGDKISISGRVDSDYSGPFFKSPSFELIENNKGSHTQGFVPNYHLTAGLTQKHLRFLIKQVIHLTKNLEEWIPNTIVHQHNLLSISDAIRKIHFPETQNDLIDAKKRLGFNELFLIQLQSQLISLDSKKYTASKIDFNQIKIKEFVDKLPFDLTSDQKKTTWQIIQDLEKDKPMTRLLEGDVGSGKTIVAAIAMYSVALNRKQAVLMVPTEILANQHYQNIKKLFNGMEINIGLITRVDKKINKEIDPPNLNEKNKSIDLKYILENADMIIGTHALIQDQISFRDLSLVIIDEQHRFGVEQRKSLVNKTEDILRMPHLLSMTATPIPRSLALAIYGDLDVSIIKEMPKGRKKIITKIVSETKRQEAYNFIRDEINRGKQVFVVCPLIDISDKLGVKSVKEEFKRLDEIIFKDFKIAMLHGKMKKDEKNNIMKDFVENKINILVSTSVIEVGVDVPNATVMIIEGSDRFGLSQLH
ncbi:MAG: ATP-dependent DNA helicase RecG, partial [Candidatus Falkowbacteria bacterium]|nr:ATP-dependent DNA helicase RecG [Candidatus Falkowbacteria bacterium]